MFLFGFCKIWFLLFLFLSIIRGFLFVCLGIVIMMICFDLRIVLLGMIILRVKFCWFWFKGWLIRMIYFLFLFEIFDVIILLFVSRLIVVFGFVCFVVSVLLFVLMWIMLNVGGLMVDVFEVGLFLFDGGVMVILVFFFLDFKLEGNKLVRNGVLEKFSILLFCWFV